MYGDDVGQDDGRRNGARDNDGGPGRCQASPSTPGLWPRPAIAASAQLLLAQTPSIAGKQRDPSPGKRWAQG